MNTTSKKTGKDKSSLWNGSPRIKVKKGSCCRICKCEEKLEHHHIIPLSEGGANIRQNLVVLCRKHHDDVHNNGLKLNLKGVSDNKFKERTEAIAFSTNIYYKFIRNEEIDKKDIDKMYQFIEEYDIRVYEMVAYNMGVCSWTFLDRYY